MTDIDMDVDMDSGTPESSPSIPDSYWVPPPSPADKLFQDADGAWIGSCWDEVTSTEERLIQFLTRWPPSRTPPAYSAWIAIDRGGNQPCTPDVASLISSFQNLITSGAVTVENLDQISRAHNVLVGKWLIFADHESIDLLWGKVIHLLCVQLKKGSAKVSTRKEGERHVICVYTEDFTDLKEVKALRAGLRRIGVRWKIGFKTDAYTHLGIYAKNEWNLRPTRYFE
jgi:hypothetical protein